MRSRGRNADGETVHPDSVLAVNGMRRAIVREAVSRLLLLGGWFVCIGLLAGLLVEAIHRGHLAGMLIVATSLAGLLVVPVLSSRLNQQ